MRLEVPYKLNASHAGDDIGQACFAFQQRQIAHIVAIAGEQVERAKRGGLVLGCIYGPGRPAYHGASAHARPHRVATGIDDHEFAVEHCIGWQRGERDNDLRKRYGQRATSARQQFDLAARLAGQHSRAAVSALERPID